VFHVESVELKRHARVIVMHHLRRMRLIKGIFIEVRIIVGVARNLVTAHGWYFGGEVRRSFPGLSQVALL
jgi:hypothetical protein